MSMTAPARVTAKQTTVHARDSFILFSFLLGAAELVHQFARHGGWMHLEAGQTLAWLLTGAAVLVVLRPSSIPLLATMLALDAANVIDRMPRVPNHIFVNGMVALTILACMLDLKLRAPRSPIDHGTLYQRFAPYLRIEVLLLYFFAALAKMNTDFLDPEVSCGAVMYEEMVRHVDQQWGVSLPLNHTILVASIWGTIILEWALPIMLLFARLRMPALIIGGLFHLGLALHDVPAIFSFSSMMFAFYVVFTPDDFATRLKTRWSDWQQRSGWRLHEPRRAKLTLFAVAAVIGLVIAGIMVVNAFRQSDRSFSADLVAQVRSIRDSLTMYTFYAFMAGAILLLVTYVYIMRRDRPRAAPMRGTFALRPSLALCLLIVLMLAGFSPYFGFRTQLAIAMFSNLRTEGGQTNHLFMPRWHLASYQDDVVQVLEFEMRTDNPWANDRDLTVIAERQLMVTRFDLQARMSQVGYPFRIRYRDGDQEVVVDSELNPDHAMCQPHSLLARKLLDFRPFDPEGPMTCRH